MKKLTQIVGRVFDWSDRVLWGNKLGRAVLLSVLLAAGVPALTAGPAADALNVALDSVTGEG